MRAGREGVRKNQVDAYGRIILTDELKEAIIQAVAQAFGLTVSTKTTNTSKTVDGETVTLKTTTNTYKFSPVTVAEEVVE